MRIAAIFLLAFFLTTCSSVKSKKGWTPEEKKIFMSDCVNGAKQGLEEKATPYCECMAHKLESKYPKYDEAGKITMSETVEMAKDCLK